MANPTTFFNQFIHDENDNDDTNIIQCFIMYGLVLCTKVDSCVGHMFYEWSFSHDISVTIAINKNKYFFPSIKTLLYLLGEPTIPIKIERNNNINEYDKNGFKIV